MTVNGKIHTILTMEEIAQIAVGLGNYIKLIGKEDKVAKEMTKLINRLGNELYSYPKFDFTKK